MRNPTQEELLEADWRRMHAKACYERDAALQRVQKLEEDYVLVYGWWASVTAERDAARKELVQTELRYSRVYAELAKRLTRTELRLLFTDLNECEAADAARGEK